MYENNNDNQIKILMLNYEFPPLGGGAGNANYYLLKEFSKFPDLNIDLITSSTDKFRVEQFAENISIHFLDIHKNNRALHYQSNKNLMTYTLKAYMYAKKLRKQKRYDLCHAFFGIPCGTIALLLRIPYIVSLRGSDVPGYSERFALADVLLFKWLSLIVWRKAQSVIALSKDLVEIAKRTDKKTNYLVVYNGIDTDEFKNKEGNNADYLQILFVGRLIQRKGLKYLLEAFRLLLEDHKKIKLHIIGDGPLLNEIKSFIAEYKLNQMVTIHGIIDHVNIRNYYNMCDLFVLPSLNEALGNVTHEALASGLPIITTNTGAAELMNGNGVVVPKEDVKALYEAINRYIENPELIYIEGKRSREIAEKMPWHNAALQYYITYGQCLK